MTRTKSTFLALLTVLLSPMVANADLIELDATTLLPGTISSFDVVFDDTGDGLLQWDEIVSFSGVLFDFSGLFTENLDVIPTIAGISTFSFDPGLSFTPTDGSWIFSTSGGRNTCSPPELCWSYKLSSVSVPEPGTLALLGIGLLGMGAARRRKKA